MKTILLVLAIIILLLHSVTTHIYKANATGYSKTNVGFILGSIISEISNIICAWYIVKTILE